MIKITNTEIIYQACKQNNTNTENIKTSNCAICGKEIITGFKAKELISGSFTNWDEIKAKNSDFVCKECYFCLKNVDLRYNNFVADKNNIHLLKKNDLEDCLFNLDKYVSDEFVIGITTSFKKHNSFRCRINNDKNNYYIRQEDKEFLFNVTELKPLYEKLNEAYLQFSKDELEKGDYKMIGIEQFGPEKFKKYENLFKRYRKSHQFNLLIYMMNSERRNEMLKEKIKKQKGDKK